MLASYTASLLQALLAAKTRAFQWVCMCRPKFKAHMMRECHAVMTTTTSGMTSMTSKKQAICTHIGTGMVGLKKKGVAGATCKYYKDDIEEDDANEEGEDAARKEDNRVSDDDVDGFEALFKSSPSLLPLCLDAWQHYDSPFSPSLFLPSTTLLLST
jgi:hypothetical protein